MPTGRVFWISAAAALLGLLPLVVAHGEAGHGPDNKTTMMDNTPERPTIADGMDTAKMGPQSYFSLSEHSGTMYAHIFLMTLAWAVILPIGK